MNACSSAAYELGHWVVSNYGTNYRLARKGERFPLVHGNGTAGTTEIDPARTFTTFGDAQAEADRRNGVQP